MSVTTDNRLPPTRRKEDDVLGGDGRELKFSVSVSDFSLHRSLEISEFKAGV